MSQETAEGLRLFSKEMCGIDLTPDQFRAARKAEGKSIFLNRSGNKWGKTFFEALVHLQMNFFKIGLALRDPRDWISSEYITSVVAPSYKGSRAMLREAIKIAEGEVWLPDGRTNQSKLKGWFLSRRQNGKIGNGMEDSDTFPPSMKTYFGGQIWGRSYDDMGAAMKQKTFWKITITEAGDFPKLHEFIFKTLIPRFTMSKIRLSVEGTPQGYRYDYSQLVNELKSEKTAYVHQGSMKENIYAPRETIKQIEKLYESDPILKMQVIYGEFVDTSETAIPNDIVEHAIDRSLPKDQEPFSNIPYIVGIDDAAETDEYSVSVLNIKKIPWVLTKHFAIQAKKMPAQLFVQELADLVSRHNHSPALFDASGHGGQIMKQLIRELDPTGTFIFVTIVGTPTNESKVQINKGDLIINFRNALSEGRNKFLQTHRDGTVEIIEENPNYGLIRIPMIYELVEQIKNYQWDDKNLKTDRLISLCLAAWGAKKRSNQSIQIIRRGNR